MTSRLKEKYKSEVVKGLVDQFGYENLMQVPKLEKNCYKYRTWRS